MLSEICYQQIKGNYWYGAYGDFKVVMMKDCGWVNATKLCKDGGKKLCDCLRLDGAKKLIHDFDLKLRQQASGNTRDDSNEWRVSDVQICTSVCKPVHTAHTTLEERLISGTYIHPNLVPHLACWISADVAWKVSEIVENFIINDYKTKLVEAEEMIAKAKVEKERLVKSLAVVKLRYNTRLAAAQREKIKITSEKTKAQIDYATEKCQNQYYCKMLSDAQTENYNKDTVIKSKDVVIEAKVQQLDNKEEELMVTSNQLIKTVDELEKTEDDLLKRKVALDIWSRYNDFVVLKFKLLTGFMYYALRTEPRQK